MRRSFINSLLSLLIACTACGIALAQRTAINVRLVTDEAEAVLAILAKRKANQPVAEADWQRVFKSEGYIRLKQRETSMQRSFEDADFKTFVLSDQLLERAQALEETLNKWKRVDATRAAQAALAYLPKEAIIRAKIYPVIKPRDNTFVFDLKNDPAIFFYLRHAGSMVHGRLEDVGADRENLWACEVDRMHLRSTEAAFHLQRGRGKA